MVAIIVASVMRGKKRGLLVSLFFCGCILFAVILARFFSPYVAAGMEKSKINEKVNAKVTVRVNEALAEEMESLDLTGAVEKLKLPKGVEDYLVKSVDGAASAKGAELAAKISEAVTNTIVKLISYAIIAIVVLIALIIILISLKIINKLPVIKQFDKLGGGIIGALLGVLTVLVVCVIVYAISVSRIGGNASTICSGSLVMNLIDKIGIIGRIIK